MMRVSPMDLMVNWVSGGTFNDAVHYCALTHPDHSNVKRMYLEGISGVIEFLRETRRDCFRSMKKDQNDFLGDGGPTWSVVESLEIAPGVNADSDTHC